MTSPVDLFGRLAVLLACGVAAAALVGHVAAPPRRPGRPSTLAGRTMPLRGLVPGALVAFIVIAGGGALTGAGVPTLTTLPAGVLDAVRGLGIGVLAACGLLVARRARGLPIAIASTSLLVAAWAGAALALVSWLAALGTAAVAVAAGIRTVPRA